MTTHLSPCRDHLSFATNMRFTLCFDAFPITRQLSSLTVYRKQGLPKQDPNESNYYKQCTIKKKMPSAVQTASERLLCDDLTM